MEELGRVPIDLRKRTEQSKEKKTLDFGAGFSGRNGKLKGFESVRPTPGPWFYPFWIERSLFFKVMFARRTLIDIFSNTQVRYKIYIFYI